MTPSSIGWNSAATTVSEVHFDSIWREDRAQSQTETRCSGLSSTVTRKMPPSVLEKDRHEMALLNSPIPR